MKDIDIDSIISTLDFEKNSLKTCSNGLLLTNYEISVLEKYNIDYNKTKSLKEVLFLIEEVLNEDITEEDLESISLSIAERDYYMNTNK